MNTIAICTEHNAESRAGTHEKDEVEETQQVLGERCPAVQRHGGAGEVKKHGLSVITGSQINK